jgi:hypothetical protein
MPDSCAPNAPPVNVEGQTVDYGFVGDIDLIERRCCSSCSTTA